MKQIKMKKLKEFIFDKDEREIIKLAYRAIKDGKIVTAKKLLDDIGQENIAYKFIESTDVNRVDLNTMQRFIVICKILYANAIDSMADTIYDQMINRYKLYRDEPVADIIVSKVLVNVDHEYPELKGNISKANVFYDNDRTKPFDVSLESFITKVFNKVYNDEPILFKLTKKWDGISGVGSYENGRIKTLLTRGEDGKGADITHLIRNLRFKHKGDCGVQFEIIISNSNKQKYEEEIGKKLANRRTAAISIVSNSKGSSYSKYLTFMPLNATDVDPSDLETLNKGFYNGGLHSGEIIEAYSISDAMEQITKYCNEIESQRDKLEFAIDGIVIECASKKDRKKLGRKDNINNFQIAYKFPAERRITKVRDITVTVGRTGLITPMAHYDPIIFSGANHDKSSISSYDRYEKLNFREGEEVLVTYNNDVMPYIQKYESDYNDNLDTPKLKFPTHCVCGEKLEKVGANYFCNNPLCEGKIVSQWTWFYKTLGVRDLGEAIVETFKNNGILNSYKDLLNLDYKAIMKLDGFGYKSVKNIEKQLNFILGNPIDEAKLITALGISGDKTCRLILSLITIEELFDNTDIIFDMDIPSIGYKKKIEFMKRLTMNKDAIMHFMNQLTVLKVNTKHSDIKVCFSGFRDNNIQVLLESLGVEVVDSVTKHINYVVVKTLDSEPTSKIKKANKYGIPIIPLGELLDIMQGIE